MQHLLQLYTSTLSNTFLSLEKFGFLFPVKKYWMLLLPYGFNHNLYKKLHIIDPFKSCLTHSDNMHWISEIKSCLE